MFFSVQVWDACLHSLMWTHDNDNERVLTLVLETPPSSVVSGGEAATSSWDSYATSDSDMSGRAGRIISVRACV